MLKKGAVACQFHWNINKSQVNRKVYSSRVEDGSLIIRGSILEKFAECKQIVLICWTCKLNIKKIRLKFLNMNPPSKLCEQKVDFMNQIAKANCKSETKKRKLIVKLLFFSALWKMSDHVSLREL